MRYLLVSDPRFRQQAGTLTSWVERSAAEESWRSRAGVGEISDEMPASRRERPHRCSFVYRIRRCLAFRFTRSVAAVVSILDANLAQGARRARTDSASGSGLSTHGKYCGPRSFVDRIASGMSNRLTVPAFPTLRKNGLEIEMFCLHT